MKNSATCRVIAFSLLAFIAGGIVQETGSTMCEAGAYVATWGQTLYVVAIFVAVFFAAYVAGQEKANN